MYSPMPTRRGARRNTTSEAPLSRPDVSPRLGSRHNMNHSITELLEPAMDGPPSPERIRAFRNQLKRASFTEKHQSQHTSSSGSSSLVSASSDRLSWEQGIETLSRKSSQRSITGGMPSRDRPESALMFGKTIFNRRGKLRRESSEVAYSTMPTTKDAPFMSAVFARRKTMKAEPDSVEQRKLQISGPYNFQHLTHTEKTNVPDLGRATGMELVSEYAGMRAGQRPSHGSLKGIQADELHFANFSSEALHVEDEPAEHDVGLSSPTRFEESLLRQKQLPASPGAHPDTRHARSPSYGQGRPGPPRLARSVTEPAFQSPIPPPPRVSSRMSVRYDGPDAISATTLERPSTATSFRQPQPYMPSPEGSRLRPLSRSLSRTPEETADDVTQSVTQSTVVADNPAWPLAPNAMAFLPEVPEEEEDTIEAHESRISIASSHSSLRGSVSVPLLRQLKLSQAVQRPTSNTSDTLGQFDVYAAQRALRAGAKDDMVLDDFHRDSWEDDIDYCYEHAAEANCDYAWERSSSEMTRLAAGDDSESFDDCHSTTSPQSRSPDLLCPGTSEAPALSPSSQTSHKTAQEAITPTILTLPVTTNFSLPDRGHNRTLSRASSFKESHGFTLSPSLLIPNDYHQQMLRYEREEADGQDDFLTHTSPYDKAAMMLKVRSSASTTDSAYSENSMCSSRHKSTTSNSTAFTRWTASSSIASSDCWQSQGDLSQSEIAIISDGNDLNATPTADVVAMTLPDFEEPAEKREHSHERHNRAASDAEVVFRTTQGSCSPVQLIRDPPKPRRRAKTTSRSHNIAPGQLGLFPHVPAPATRS
eukprot:GHVU01123262.1.p1 GENE.GHVU01123262.1~~GHVU01123262.1.p1  ORF type:complete len:818 (+),score=53.84 GHVU01123262.1:1390-3843(+)